MFASAFAVELRFMVARVGVRGWLFYALGLVLFGYLVPQRYGLGFLDVAFLMAYACLPGLFVAGLAADGVDDDVSEGSPAVTFAAQIAAAAVVAWAWGVIVLLIGIAVANAGNARFVWPNPAIFVNCLVLGIAMTLLASAAAGWMTLHFKSKQQAKSTARRAYLLLLLGVVVWARFGPRTWREAVDNRLTAEGIWVLLMPISAALLSLAGLLVRFGGRYREDRAAGPLFKI